MIDYQELIIQGFIYGATISGVVGILGNGIMILLKLLNRA